MVCHPTAIYSWGEGEDDLRRRIAEASGTLDTPAYAKVSPATVAKKLVKEGVISFLPFDLIQEDVDQGQMTILHPQDYPDYKWRLGVAVRDRKVDGHELDALWHTLGT